MTSVTAWNSIDGLPKQFLTSLRILFDILDEKKCGYVRLQDIETRWHEEGVQGLPSGVTDALRKVAPPNGYLSFERFVSGLKLALLTSKTKVTGNRGNQNSEKENIVNNSEHGGKHNHRLPPSGNTNIEESSNPKEKNLRKRLPSNSEITSSKDQRQRLPSNSELTNSKEIGQTQRRPVQNVLYNSTNQRSHNVNNPTATVRPNNVQGQSWRNPQNHDTKIDPSAPSLSREVHHKVQTGLPPPRPERQSPHNSQPDSQLPPTIPPRGDTSKLIINELKNWQRRMNRTPHDKANSDSKLLDHNPHDPAQSDIYVNIAQLNVSDHGPASSSHPKSASVKRRDSARRHTLSSGVDSNMIKRAKQLEEEKQILLQGLAMVDQARVWYLKRINLMEEKQKYVSKASHSDYNLEAMQERMNFEKARISEVNHQIKTLVESSEKGFPLHMNLAMTSSNKRLEQNTVRLIKEQNRQLTKEISQKSDKITQLEQEKASLIRDLFEARSQNKTNYDDTTFM